MYLGKDATHRSRRVCKAWFNLDTFEEFFLNETITI